MKHLLMLLFFAMSLISCASCSKDTSGVDHNNNPNPTRSKMKIKIGNSTFTATLYDNSTVTAFKSRLPMTVTMIELNGNEKYFDLPKVCQRTHLIQELYKTVICCCMVLTHWCFFTKHFLLPTDIQGSVVLTTLQDLLLPLVLGVLV
jgi:hypothetical protein